MKAYEYIRKVKGIPQTESITDLSYSLSIEEVIELMDGYKAVKNNVGLADVMHRRELLIAFMELLEKKAEMGIKNKDSIIFEFLAINCA